MVLRCSSYGVTGAFKVLSHIWRMVRVITHQPTFNKHFDCAYPRMFVVKIRTSCHESWGFCSYERLHPASKLRLSLEYWENSDTSHKTPWRDTNSRIGDRCGGHIKLFGNIFAAPELHLAFFLLNLNIQLAFCNSESSQHCKLLVGSLNLKFLDCVGSACCNEQWLQDETNRVAIKRLCVFACVKRFKINMRSLDYSMSLFLSYKGTCAKQPEKKRVGIRGVHWGIRSGEICLSVRCALRKKKHAQEKLATHSTLGFLFFSPSLWNSWVEARSEKKHFYAFDKSWAQFVHDKREMEFHFKIS